MFISIYGNMRFLKLIQLFNVGQLVCILLVLCNHHVVTVERNLVVLELNGEHRLQGMVGP
jgi:hypothetical protein